MASDHSRRATARPRALPLPTAAVLPAPWTLSPLAPPSLQLLLLLPPGVELRGALLLRFLLLLPWAELMEALLLERPTARWGCVAE